MDILLVNPPCRMPNVLPLGLGYIASVLREDGHSVSLIDLNAEPKTLVEIERCLEKSQAKLIGIGGLTTTYNFVKRFSDSAKRVKPDAKLVAGNMVSTAYPELLLRNSEIDICVIDEGEDTVVELARRIGDYPRLDDVNGIAFKRDGSIIVTGQRKRIDDLDRLPYPAWDLFPMEIYINNPIDDEYGKRSMNVSAIRGCPFQCIYCSRPFGSQVYSRSPAGVVSEIKALKNSYHIEYVGFSDDLFMVKRKWVMELCDEMIRQGLRIGWGASARVNLVDPVLLQKMRQAGCEGLSYGFESGSQKILDIMKKNVKVEQAETAIEMTRKAGIKVFGSFMIGMTGETEETVNETVEFVKRTGLALHRFFYTTPYPGTPLYETAKQMNRIPQDEDAYVGSLGEMHNTLLVNLTEMTDSQLKDIKETAEKRIKDSFSLSTRLEIAREESRRVLADVRKRIRNEGLVSTLNWSLAKIRKRG